MIKQIEVFRLVPHSKNPRLQNGDLTELRDSIAANGIFQNLTVVENETVGLYTVIIGHRRLAAAIMAGLETVPCVVVEMDEKKQQATMLLENMQRSDLTVYEQAQGMQMCLDLGMTEMDITNKTGFSKSTVRRRLKILELNKDKVQSAQGTIEEYMALEEIADVDVRNKLLQFMGTNNFNLEVEKARLAQEQIKSVSTSSEETDSSPITAEVSKSTERTEKSDRVEVKLEVYKNLRINFMTDVFKRKIAKEETAACVLFSTLFMIENNFEIQSDNKIFNKIANPNSLNEDDLIKRIEKNRINFFVISTYSIVEKLYSFIDIYSFMEVFGYVLSSEEQELLSHVKNTI